jgi:5-methylcytosine-specific restriction protein A
MPAWQGSSWTRGSDRAWRRTRAAQLAREPWCRLCRDRGQRTRATTVDHVTPLSRGGAKHDPCNLRSLCGDCHEAVTAAARHNRPVRIKGADVHGFPLDPSHPWAQR